MMDTFIDLALRKLANMLTITCSSSTYNNLGLLRGKLGASIFLLHYAKYSNEEKYESYAMDLFEFVQNNLANQNNNIVNHYLIDVETVTSYIVSQRLVLGNLDDLLKKTDSFLLSYLDNHNILYLKYRVLIKIGKYFLLRIDAAPTSANHSLHVIALERVVELLKLHIRNIPICNPAIVKFLYYVAKILSDKSIESLLIQQLNNYPNKTNWYRSNIPNWFSMFFIPHDNELLRGIIMKEIIENSHIILERENSDILINGNSGLIIWMNLLLEDKSVKNYNQIKNTAIKKIVSNINNYIISTDLSIYNGCSGIGLTLLSCLDRQCNQWINLL